MNDLNTLENIAAYNEESLGELSRSLFLSQGAFSLIFVRCNYEFLRGEIVRLLHRQSSVEFEELVLDKSATNLYAAISNFCSDRSPDALMVFGLESVVNLDIFLELTNRVRDEFSRFPFPIVLWATNTMLKKLIRQASDFNTYASSPISFSLPDRELIEFLSKKVEKAFNGDDNLQMDLSEIEAFRRDLESRQSELDEESKAYLAFLVGWGYGRRKQIDAAVDKYQECWQFWQQHNELECRGIVELNMALAYEKAGEKYRQQARDYLEKSLESFELANRPDLVARHISKLGGLLQKLEDWESLKKVAEKALKLHIDALKLHIDSGKIRQLAQDYGFLARVAFQGLNWWEAKELILLAWVINEDNLSDRDKGWHRFILARCQQELGEVEKAVDNFKEATSYLESARQERTSEYDAKLHVKILNSLRDLLFEKKEYLAAFQFKLERRKIESQYRLRAFIGAGRLQTPPSAMDAAEKTTAEKTKIAREIVVASGREPDVENLMGKIQSTQNKLTVIYGQSGVGKSSILQAGLIPALQLNYFEGRRYVPVLVQVYQNWLGSLGKELVKGLNKKKGTSVIANFSAETILEELRKNQERYLLTVLIFDQFEEFFFECQDISSCGEFYKFLYECLEIPYLKIILSLREDYFHCLLEFTRLFPNLKINKNYDEIIYYLGNFSRSLAKAVIASLTKDTPTQLDGDLVEELVEDLAKEFDYVRPIELQVVGTQLEREKISSLEEYKKKGPKNALVRRFLEDSIKDSGPENEETAKLILYFLTDEKETRPLKTLDDLKSELYVKVEAETIELVLEILVKSGLVLRVPRFPQDRYQLVHDYLVGIVRELQSNKLIDELNKKKEQLKLTQEQLNKTLKKQLRTARQAAITLVGLLVVIAGIAAGATLFGINSHLSSLTASSKQNKELDRLVSAIEAGKRFKLLSFGVLTENKLRVAEELNQAVYGLQERARLEGHESSVTKVGFSDDGKIVASISQDGIVKVWGIDGSSLSPPSPSIKLDEDKGNIFSVSISPDNKTIALAEGKTIKFYSIKSGTLINTFSEHEENVTSISFSPDGTMFASATEDGVIKLWNLFSDNIMLASASENKAINWSNFDGVVSSNLSRHEGSIISLSFSQDSQFLASADNQDQVILWNLNTGNIKKFENYGTVDIKFSDDDQTIIFANRDGTVKLYSLEGELLKNINAYSDDINAIAVSSDRYLLAFTVSYRNKDINIQEIVRHYREIKNMSHTESITYLMFGPNDNILASASRDKIVKLWRIDHQLYHWRNLLTGIHFTANGNIVTVGIDNKIKLWNGEGEFLKNLDPADLQPNFIQDRDTITTKANADTKVKIRSIDGKESTLQGYSGSLTEIRFSPTSETIAAINGKNTIKFWQSDGTSIATVTGSSERITNLKFSLDGKLIAAIGDKEVDIFSNKGDRIKTLENDGITIEDVLFSPDGKTIVFIDRKNRVKLWSSDGNFIKRLETEKHPHGINKILFSPDSELIASIGEDNLVNLWRRDGEHVKRLIRHEEQISSISFSRDNILASVSGGITSSRGENSTIELWGPDGKRLLSNPIETSNATDIHFSPDGKKIASIHENNVIKLWEAESGDLIKTLKGHNDRITNISFSQDSKLIVSGSKDRTVRVWSVDGDREFEAFRGHDRGVNRVSFSADGRGIFSLSTYESEDKKSIHTTLKLWELNGKVIDTIKGKTFIENTVNFAGDGEPINSVRLNNWRFFWEVSHKNNVDLSSDRKLINSVSQDDESNYTVSFFNEDGKEITTSKEAKEVSSFSFSPDGKMVAIATNQNYSFQLENLDGSLLGSFEGHNGWINSASISSDGETIVSGSDDKTIKLWTKDGQLLETMLEHTEKVNSVIFSPNDRIIASGSDDKTVRLWRKNGELIKTLPHTDKVTRVIFSPDGKYLAAASEDEKVKIWKIDCVVATIKIWKKDCAEGKTIDGRGDLLSFSPDNKKLAFASYWNKGVSIYLLNGMWFKQANLITNGRVFGISFSPDSQSIAVAHEDEKFSILKWDIDELLQEACGLGRNHLKHNPNMKDKRHLCDGVGD